MECELMFDVVRAMLKDVIDMLGTMATMFGQKRRRLVWRVSRKLSRSELQVSNVVCIMKVSELEPYSRQFSDLVR